MLPRNSQVNILGRYNSLTDPNLAEFYSNKGIKKQLLKAGLITPNGTIIPDNVYVPHIIRLENQDRMIDIVRNSLDRKYLEDEWLNRKAIEKKQDEIIKMMKVHRIKVEQKRNKNMQVLPDLKLKYKEMILPHSNVDHNSAHNLSMNNESRRCQSATKIQNTKNTRSRSFSAKTRGANNGSDDSSMMPSHVYDNSIRVSRGTIDRQCSPLNYNNSYSMEIDSWKSKMISSEIGSKKISSVYMQDSPYLYTRQITSPKKKKHSSTKLHKSLTCKQMSDGSPVECRVTLLYLGKASSGYNDLHHSDDVLVEQNSFYNNIVRFKGTVQPNEKFSFISRRTNMCTRFSLVIYIDGEVSVRVNKCCEARYKAGSKLGGSSGYFKWVGVKNPVPCIRCYDEMKETPVKKSNGPKKKIEPQLDHLGVSRILVTNKGNSKLNYNIAQKVEDRWYVIYRQKSNTGDKTWISVYNTVDGVINFEFSCNNEVVGKMTSCCLYSALKKINELNRYITCIMEEEPPTCYKCLRSLSSRSSIRSEGGSSSRSSIYSMKSDDNKSLVDVTRNDNDQVRKGSLKGRSDGGKRMKNKKADDTDAEFTYGGIKDEFTYSEIRRKENVDKTKSEYAEPHSARKVESRSSFRRNFNFGNPSRNSKSDSSSEDDTSRDSSSPSTDSDRGSGLDSGSGDEHEKSVDEENKKEDGGTVIDVSGVKPKQPSTEVVSGERYTRNSPEISQVKTAGSETVVSEIQKNREINNSGVDLHQNLRPSTSHSDDSSSSDESSFDGSSDSEEFSSSDDDGRTSGNQGEFKLTLVSNKREFKLSYVSNDVVSEVDAIRASESGKNDENKSGYDQQINNVRNGVDNKNGIKNEIKQSNGQVSDLVSNEGINKKINNNNNDDDDENDADLQNDDETTSEKTYVDNTNEMIVTKDFQQESNENISSEVVTEYTEQIGYESGTLSNHEDVKKNNYEEDITFNHLII